MFAFQGNSPSSQAKALAWARQAEAVSRVRRWQPRPLQPPYRRPEYLKLSKAAPWPVKFKVNQSLKQPHQVLPHKVLHRPHRVIPLARKPRPTVRAPIRHQGPQRKSFLSTIRYSDISRSDGLQLLFPRSDRRNGYTSPEKLQCGTDRRRRRWWYSCPHSRALRYLVLQAPPASE